MKSAKQMLPKFVGTILCIGALFDSGVVLSSDTDNFSWPEKSKAAIVLTYDDTLNSHLDVAVPQLNTAGLKGTFYISGARGDISGRMKEWRAVSKRGHELANHTLYHPCRKTPTRDWVSADYDMVGYSVEQYVNELKVTNTLLQALDGQTERTFAYTCGDTAVGEFSVVEAIQDTVIAARAVTPDGYNTPGSVDYYNIRSQDMSNKTGQELIAFAEKARKNKQMMVYLFHGVGGDYLSVDAQAHQELVSYVVDGVEALQAVCSLQLLCG